jgi:hypothetical protein
MLSDSPYKHIFGIIKYCITKNGEEHFWGDNFSHHLCQHDDT